MEMAKTLKRPGAYQFPTMVARLARKTEERASGFNSFSRVLLDRLIAEANRKRKAYPALIELLRGTWRRYEKARLDAGFIPTVAKPLPAADFIAENAKEMFPAWFNRMCYFDPGRLSHQELPGRGNYDYNGILHYAFNNEEVSALDDAVRLPGSSVRDVSQAILKLLVDIIGALAKALEESTRIHFDVVCTDSTVDLKKETVEASVSFKLRQD